MTLQRRKLIAAAAGLILVIASAYSTYSRRPYLISPSTTAYAMRSDIEFFLFIFGINLLLYNIGIMIGLRNSGFDDASRKRGVEVMSDLAITGALPFAIPCLMAIPFLTAVFSASPTAAAAIPLAPSTHMWLKILGYAIGFALMIAYMIHRHRRRHVDPLLRPVCQHCGYSMKGLTSDRCPECGELQYAVSAPEGARDDSAKADCQHGQP